MQVQFSIAEEPDAYAAEKGRMLFAGETLFVKGVVAMDGLPPADRMVMVAHAGGAHHAECIPGGGTPVSLEWLEAAELARRSPLRESIDAVAPQGPSWALAESIEAHLGSSIRSRSVLRALVQPTNTPAR